MELEFSATSAGPRVTRAWQLASLAGQGRGAGPWGRGRLADRGGAARGTARPSAAAVIPIVPTDGVGGAEAQEGWSNGVNATWFATWWWSEKAGCRHREASRRVTKHKSAYSTSSSTSHKRNWEASRWVTKHKSAYRGILLSHPTQERVQQQQYKP